MRFNRTLLHRAHAVVSSSITVVRADIIMHGVDDFATQVAIAADLVNFLSEFLDLFYHQIILLLR